MFVAIQTVCKGDTIKETYLDGNGRLKVEKGPGTTVSKVEHSACSKRGTHINGRECFDFGALVWKIDTSVLVDWDIDNNVPAEPERVGGNESSKIQPVDERAFEVHEITVGEYLEAFRSFTLVSANEMRESLGMTRL